MVPIPDEPAVMEPPLTPVKAPAPPLFEEIPQALAGAADVEALDAAVEALLWFG